MPMYDMQSILLESFASTTNGIMVTVASLGEGLGGYNIYRIRGNIGEEETLAIGNFWIKLPIFSPSIIISACLYASNSF